MKTERRAKIVAAIATALLFLSFIGIMYIYESRSELGGMLNTARLESEKILSEKLLLDKEIARLSANIDVLSGKNNRLDVILATTREELEQKKSEISSIQWDKQKSRKLEIELTDIRKIRLRLESQIASLINDMSRMKQDNDDLTNIIAQLRDQNQSLEVSNDLLRAMVTDNFRVDATKGKGEKLTVVAKKAGKISVGFDVPQDVVEKINFKIKTPEGIVVAENDGIAFTVASGKSELLASAADDTGEINTTKRIEMTYTPKQKLLKGIYKIEVWNGDSYMGSCQVKLR